MRFGDERFGSFLLSLMRISEHRTHLPNFSFTDSLSSKLFPEVRFERLATQSASIFFRQLRGLALGNQAAQHGIQRPLSVPWLPDSSPGSAFQRLGGLWRLWLCQPEPGLAAAANLGG